MFIACLLPIAYMQYAWIKSFWPLSRKVGNFSQLWRLDMAKVSNLFSNIKPILKSHTNLYEPLKTWYASMTRWSSPRASKCFSEHRACLIDMLIFVSLYCLTRVEIFFDKNPIFFWTKLVPLSPQSFTER